MIGASACAGDIGQVLTGERRLRSYLAGDGVDSSPTVVNGVIYAGSPDGNLYAFRLPGGLVTPARPSPGTLHPSDSLRTQRP